MAALREIKNPFTYSRTHLINEAWPVHADVDAVTCPPRIPLHLHLD